MSSKLDENGHEKLDNTPVELPLGFQHPETLEDRIKRLVRTSVSAQAQTDGEETFEEADDFDIPDDDSDPVTPYELDFDPALGRDVSPQMILENKAVYDDLTNQRVPETGPEPSATETMAPETPVVPTDDTPDSPLT